ncbi:MAG: hypothetical protein ACRD68_04220, partial [Pyrinomonadaceae bacterium]
MSSLARQTSLEAEAARASAYWAGVLKAAGRLVANLDREPDSTSYGSFDREHWGWKFRDFPITMLQSAVYPLALLWQTPHPENPYHRNPQALAWVEAAVESIRRRQHRSGAFDGTGPHTQEYGVTLAMCYFLCEVTRLVGGELSPAVRRRIDEVVRRGCEFALGAGEDYAFISNHHALYALAFHDAGALLDEPRYGRRAEEIIDQIVSEQSGEGWYREYGGPDPGYESLGIFYLATYWERTGSERLLASLRRSVEFYSHFVAPDGSVGGVYGSRHTSLYYPGGFEILAREIPLAAKVAEFMRERLGEHNVVTPEVCDAENLPSLSYSYLEACRAAAPPARGGALPPLPCEALDGLRHFPESQLSVAGTGEYYAVVNAAKGGVCRVFDKRTGRVAYEDAGYIVRAGGRRWTSQMQGLGRRADSERADEIVCEARLAEVRQMLPSPANFILLRALNLTLFRSLGLGNWLRRLIVGRLIT